MDARITHPVEDQNGEKCALIKVIMIKFLRIKKSGVHP